MIGTPVLMACRAATTANITLSYPGGTYTIDGVVINPGDRLLVKNQATVLDNGIYIFATSGTFPRAYDLEWDTAAPNGVLVFVREGAQKAIWAIQSTAVVGPTFNVGLDTMTITAV